MNSRYRFETLCLHHGQQPDPDTRARAVPVHRTSSYVFKDTAHAADLFALQEKGNIYSRIMNPTNAVLEERLSALEGGRAALALASGTTAVHYTIINLCTPGDEVVSSVKLYGGTHTLFDALLPQFGITTRFVDPGKAANFEAAITDRTRALYLESIGNPSLEIPDIEAVAAIARKHHLPLIVDATFTTPYLLQCLKHGADIVIHSLTKWIGGHGTAIGGAVVDRGDFDWTDPKFAAFNKPDPGYHGLRFAHDLDPADYPPFITRLRLVPLRNLGACLAPDNAWIFLQGLETLPLRMERHSANALRVAEFLQDHPRVAWVRYPGLPSDPCHDTARKYLKNGCGGMVVFGITGGRPAGAAFIDKLQLFSHLANVGDAKSLALHPGSTTHAQLSEAQQQEAGITPEMIRLSIGLEHPEDILADLKQALE